MIKSMGRKKSKLAKEGTKSPLKALVFCLFIIALTACSGNSDTLVIMSTPYGEMKAVLYDDTPKHKANFLKLARKGKFDSVIFHRVIENFMIQTGDLSTGTWGEAADYQIEAEFLPEKYMHEKGALAAARQPDSRNLEKKSSGSQFYIVQGEKYDDAGLQARGEYREFLKLNGYFERLMRVDRYIELKEKYNYYVIKSQEDSTYDFNVALKNLVYNSKEFIEKEFGPQVDPGFNDFQKERYATVGGTPHLDGEYTVFGRVVEGLEVIDKIAAQKTNYRDKPEQDIRMHVRLEKVKRAVLTEKYGIKYPDK